MANEKKYLDQVGLAEYTQEILKLIKNKADGITNIIGDTTELGDSFENIVNEIIESKEALASHSGKLTFGSYVYDGTEDVDVRIYEGETRD